MTPDTIAELEGRLPAMRAAIASAMEELVAELRVFRGCHNYRVNDLNATWWVIFARERERLTIGTEKVAKARVALEELLAAEVEIINAIREVK